MEITETIHLLVTMSRALRPGPSVSPDQLSEALHLLASCLRAAEPEFDAYIRSVMARFAPPQAQLAETVRLQLESWASSAVPVRDSRILVRDFPVRTSGIFDPLPSWAAGVLPARTFGPFLDTLDRQVWIEVLAPSRHFSLVNEGSPVVLLAFPVPGAVAASRDTVLSAGSIWIKASLFSSDAPASAYVGMAIRGGTLSFADARTATGTQVRVPAGTQWKLALDLNVPASGGSSAGPNSARGQLPARVLFVFDGTNARLESIDNVALELSGSAIPLRYTPARASFEASARSLVFPLISNVRVARVNIDSEGLFGCTGEGQLLSTGWALPATARTPDHLGEASGCGGLLVSFGAGLAASWGGVQDTPVSLAAPMLVAEPARFSLTGVGAPLQQTRRKWPMWVFAGAEDQRAFLECQWHERMVVRFASDADGNEQLVVSGGELRSGLDRPLTADNLPLPIPGSPTLSMEIVRDASGLQLSIMLDAARPTGEAFAVALCNALLTLTPLRTFRMAGRLDSEGTVSSGHVIYSARLISLVPMLADPYVANVDTPATIAADSGVDWIASHSWETPSSSSFEMTLEQQSAAGRLPLARPIPPKGGTFDPAIWKELLAGAGKAAGQLPPAPPAALNPRPWNRADDKLLVPLLDLFRKTIGAPTSWQYMMVDVSSASDQFGVAIGFDGPSSITAIQGSCLAMDASHVQGFLLPSHQWEPLWTVQDPSDPHFPSPLVSLADGGPTLFGVRSAKLVRIDPGAVIDHVLAMHHDEIAPEPVAVICTLPFGMRAVVVLDALPSDHSDLSEVRPSATAMDLEGARQLSIQAPPTVPGAPSPLLHGACVQTANGVGVSGGRIEMRSGLGQSEEWFNAQFGPSGRTPGVPLSRCDLSGGGASMFSKWEDPVAAFGVSQVHFDVMLGRTAYEAVQLRSIVYPFGLRIVRTITIRRSPGGRVERKDSGWVAAGPALFDFPADASGPIHVHPGLFRGLENVTHIRETSQSVTIAGGAELVAIRFDAEALIRYAEEGAVGPTSLDAPPGTARVPARDWTGYALRRNPGNISTTPTGPQEGPLTPAQFKDLLKRQIDSGGKLECKIRFGNNGHQFRASRTEVGVAPDGADGLPQFAAVTCGALALPGDGSWSFVKLQTNPEGPTEPVDAFRGVPVVQQGLRGAAPSPESPFEFREPADLGLAPELVHTEYAIVHGMDMQRILYPNLYLPPVTAAAPAPSLAGHGPLLIADSFAIPGTVGPFPAASDCTPIPEPAWRLVPLGTPGSVRLDLPGIPATGFSPSATEVEVVRNDGVSFLKKFIDGDGNPTQILYRYSSTHSPSWEFRISGYELWQRHETLGEVNGMALAVSGQAGQATRFEHTQLRFGGIFAPLGVVIDTLRAMAPTNPVAVGMTNRVGQLSFAYSINRQGASALGGARLPETDPGGDLGLDIAGFVGFDPVAMRFAGGVELVIGGTLKIRVAAIVYLLVLVELHIKFSSDSGFEIKLRIGVGIGLGNDSGPVKFLVAIIVGVDLRFVPSFQIYVFGMFRLELEILGGLVSVKAYGEGVGTLMDAEDLRPGTPVVAGAISEIEHVPTSCPVGTSFMVLQFRAGIEVTVCWFLKFSFEWTDQVHNPQLPPGATPCSALG